MSTVLIDNLSADLKVASVIGSEQPVEVILSEDGWPVQFDGRQHTGHVTDVVLAERWTVDGCVWRGYVDRVSRLPVASA